MNSAWLAGGNPANGRIADDWYATNPQAVEMLLDAVTFKGKKILEPCVGGGHIANVLQGHFPEGNMSCIDLVDRGYKDTTIGNFLDMDFEDRFDTIITNPPYKYAQDFCEKCLSLLEDDGKLALFLKIQFLEGLSRKKLFDEHPPKYIYVFRRRIQVFPSGQPVNPKTGKHWNSLLTSAWYIWEKNSQSEPIVRWLD